jgi:zinc finger BED domain-containing protein 1 (E3 SUMO-protein ligase ZBED1)
MITLTICIICLQVKSQMGKVGDRVVEVPTAEPTPTKRLSGMAMLLGQPAATPPPRVITTQMRTRNDLEMEQYSAEEAVSFETNALIWWSDNETKYSQLARIARKFLCVPACVVPAKRINHQVREKFERQRAAIALDMVDMMVFLNGNHK